MNLRRRRLATPPRRSLYRQFMGSLLMPFVLVFMLAGAGTVLIGYHAQRDKVEAERAELLEVYARSLVKPLWDCDTATLNGIAHALAHQNGVVNVQLFDVCSGQAISTAALSDHPDVTPPIRRPIFYDGVTDRSFLVGELAAQFTKPSMRSSALELFWRYLILFVALFAVMLVGTLRAFRRIVDAPLIRFHDVISMQMTASSTIQRLRDLAIEKKNDELGDVMTAYGDLMTELDSRFKRQQTLAQCASDLLATSSHDSSPLAEVLERVRRTVDAGRIYLAEQDLSNTSERRRFRATALAGQGFAPGTGPADHILGGHDALWAEPSKERPSFYGDSNELPAVRQTVLRQSGVRRLAVFPVWGQSHWYGFLCVEDLDKDRDWTPSESTFLQTVGDMIGAFLENAYHRRQLAAAVERLRENEKTLMRIARRDPLTGLGNRIVLDEQLELAVLRAQRLSLQGYVMLIDLDHFKRINDTHGHSVGDEVLKQTARRLVESVRRTDTVIRLGGDEFVIIVEGEPTPPDLAVLCRKLAANIYRPQIHDGHTMAVGASIGAAVFPADGTSSDALLAQADKNMYSKKAHSAEARFL